MIHSPVDLQDPIDAVITWVNGSSADHRKSRQGYMAQAQRPLHLNAVNPHRWDSQDEVLFCLQSIHNFAPWIRKIWIVVDNKVPDLSRLSKKVRAKVRFAFHREIFAGFEAALPTFNSLAIESLIWRIDGLAERFVYFNDDVFLTAPLNPADVFQGAAPVLRGNWVNHSALSDSPAIQDDPAYFNHFMQINAAGIVGFPAEHIFRAAHVVHPLCRSRMARLFDLHRDHFRCNISHRFRDLSQFLPQGLHNHACIADREAVFSKADDHLHIKSGQGNGEVPSQTRAFLHSANNCDIKFLCVNDLPQLEQLVPDARYWLSQAIGGFSEIRIDHAY